MAVNGTVSINGIFFLQKKFLFTSTEFENVIKQSATYTHKKI